MLKIPRLVMTVATRLHEEGCIYAEAYPMMKWRKMGWPEDEPFYKMVDGVLKIMRVLETHSSGSWSDS